MCIRFLIIAFFLSISSQYLRADINTERLKFYYGVAEGNYLVGDLVGAESSVEQILRVDPNHLPALSLRARILFDKGQPELALLSADRVSELDPSNLKYKLSRALILGNLQRRDEATKIIDLVLNEATVGSEDASAAQQLLGLLLMADGEFDKAADAFNDIYSADSSDDRGRLRLRSEAYIEKARAAMSEGNANLVIEAMEQAIAVYPEQGGSGSLIQRSALRLTRARMLAQLGHAERAIKDLQILTGQQPENFEALITLATLYASQGRWQSLERLITPISKHPNLRDVALFFEGRAAMSKGRVGTARAKFEAAIKILPKDADLLRRSLFFYRGLCLKELGRDEEAQSQILSALDAGFRPETSDEALIACSTLLRADRAKDAIPHLEAITLNRIEPSAKVWAMLGRAHWMTGTPALAISALNESISINPKQSEAYALRGSVRRIIENLEGALSDYKSALQHAPDNHAIRYAEGLTYLQIGRVRKAETSISQAAAELRDQPELQLIHTLLAYTVGDSKSAKRSLRAYQDLVTKEQNPSAIYLDYLLKHRDEYALSKDPVIQYFRGKSDRKKTLDNAGIATSPEKARQQICATSFWMAQWHTQQGEAKESRELLNIAIQTGHPDFTEYQLANWLLQTEVSP